MRTMQNSKDFKEPNELTKLNKMNLVVYIFMFALKQVHKATSIIFNSFIANIQKECCTMRKVKMHLVYYLLFLKTVE